MTIYAAGDHRDRHRAESFGLDAHRYDRARPGYPPDLIGWLTANGPGLAVDVGCGTGQVSRQLLAAGWQVIGVEVDARMAAVARTHGVNVEVAAFETWQPANPGTEYDLVCSGSAWHWVDPHLGARKAAALLRPGGQLAVFWNYATYEPAVETALSAVFARHAPGIWATSLLGAAPPRPGPEIEAIASTQLFDAPHQRVFSQTVSWTFEQWEDEARTHSPIALLPSDVCTTLFAAAASAVRATSGERLTIRYDARVASATRRHAD